MSGFNVNSISVGYISHYFTVGSDFEKLYVYIKKQIKRIIRDKINNNFANIGK